MKSRDGQRQREEKEQKREEQKREEQKKKNAGTRKGRKVAKQCFSNDLWLRRVEK